MYKTIDTLLNLFEYHEPNENGSNEKQRQGYWSFKLEAINSDNKLYLEISTVIRDANLDEDSRYEFTVEALEAMKEILTDTDTPKGEELGALEHYENIEQHSEAPIYNSKLDQWISHNMYCLEDELNEMGWNGEEGGIYNSISHAYTRAWENHYNNILQVVINTS